MVQITSSKSSINFIDFALYIMHAKPLSEFDRLSNAWTTAVDDTQTSPNRVHAVKNFARKEGYILSIEECRDAVDFWDKFKLKNPNCNCFQPGPVTY